MEERDVLVLPVEQGPGWLANMTSNLGQDVVNIEVIYVALDNHLVIVPKDMASAQAALAS